MKSFDPFSAFPSVETHIIWVLQKEEGNAENAEKVENAEKDNYFISIII